MKKIAMTFLATTAMVSAASAADLAARYNKAPPPLAAAAYNWTGLYIGVNGGWAFSSSGTGDLVASDPLLAPAIAAGGVPTNRDAKHQGGFGGGQIGYNWQMNQFVFGLEADIQGADIGRTNATFFPGGGGIVPINNTARDHIDWFGTARARLGFAANTALFYVTGGAAFGGVQSSVSSISAPPFPGSTFSGSSSDTRFGWSAGAGVEWAFAPNWTVRGEYLHVDLGRNDVAMNDPAAPGVTATYRFHHEFDAVRVGVNYKFGGPVVAKF
ncbi:outer membrane protein [Bradyrhizobium guangdongense]|nr:outer membrane protein [Bradyrhizobium guangdongense]